MLDNGTTDFERIAPLNPPSKFAIVAGYAGSVLDIINKVGLAIGIACMMMLIGFGLGTSLAQRDIANIVHSEITSAANHIARGCVSAGDTWRDKSGVNCDGPALGPAGSPGHIKLPPPGPAHP
jgi:hypothetical protein